jgi:broad specificity phosphatase PhoE
LRSSPITSPVERISGPSSTSAARTAARVAAYAAAYAADAAQGLWDVVRADVERLERTRNPVELLSRRLWSTGEPTAELRSFLNRRWQHFSRRLLAADPEWKVWTDWYSARWNGRPAMAEEIEIFRVTLNGESDWEKGPAHVNRLIAEKIAEVEGKDPRQDPQTDAPPLPPPPKAASIEPRVVRGKVAVPSTVAELSFDSPMMTAILGALAGEVAALAADMRATPQYDQHAVAHLERIAGKLEAGQPTHTAFFAVCMEYETLRDFRARVVESWPEIFVSRYLTALSTLKSAVDKFPPWREFRKAHPDDEPELTSEQMAVLRAAAEATITELRAPENEAFVDPSTPEAVEKLAEEFAVVVAESTATADPLPLRMALRARDFVESLANTAKSFAKLGAKVSAAAAPVGGYAKRVGGKMADGFTKELEKSLEKIAKDAGKEAPYAIGRFLKRAFIGGIGGVTLATAFPEAFGWLPAFIAALTAGAAPAVLPKRRRAKKSDAEDDEKG